MVLTDAADGEETNGVVRGLALWEEGLQDVHAEREGHDGLRAGPNDHTLNPEPDERHERAERLHDVGIVRSTLRDHTAQLGVAIGTHLR